jgi:hypothetical protein
MGNRDKSLKQVGDLIERYLEGRSTYPQEWNDFVDSSQKDKKSELYRNLCYELDPLVSRPEGPDPDAIAKLKLLLEQIRSTQSN